MKKFVLRKIDLLDTYIFADIFDDEKYQIITDSSNINDLILIALNLFKKENPQFNDWNDWIKEAENKGYEVDILRNFYSIFKTSLILLDPIIEQSLKLALKWHKDNKRKTGTDTDVVHLLQVANILRLQNRSNPDKYLIASAFCHDLLEDTKCSEKELEKVAGKKVLKIVKACTNDPKFKNKKDWEQKKVKYIKSVKEGGENAMLVSLADKVSNAKSLIEVHQKIGNKIWKSFNRGKEKKLWFEKRIYNMFEKNLKNRQLLKTYKQLINEIDLNLN